MTIQLTPYDSRWPKLFGRECNRLSEKGRGIFYSIDHIGSTSVPGLCAKPYIDMVISVENLSVVPAAEKVLKSCGYDSKGTYNIPFRWFFRRDLTPEVRFHIHLVEKENPERDHWLLLRDFLRKNPLQSHHYADLKKSLHQSMAHQDTPSHHIFSDYTRAKNDFIQSLLEQAGAKKICIRLCSHDQEWEVAETLAGSDVRSITSQGIHMVAYEGAKIGGYLFVQDSESSYTIKNIFTAPWANDKVKAYFLDFAKRWVLFQRAGHKDPYALIPTINEINKFSWWA
jgi:GrpB-like predicted nucleotidyltransferase (UPF0157 family)